MESPILRDAPAVWLAQTKFHPPRLRDDVLPRPRLLAALRDALASHPLTLLSAPAGYGKTTLLGEWVQANRKLQTPNSKVQTPNAQAADDLKFEVGGLEFSWLSLDEDDNDPLRFLAAVVAALQRIKPGFGVAVQASLNEAASPLDLSEIGARMRRVAVVLINDILETLPDPFVLILDDLHLITAAAAFVALDTLVERLPPQMRFVAATRHDPPLALARLRARGQLAELRLADLRFTHDEAAEFLNDRLRLGLAPDDLLALETRTEGWAVGLRLTAGSLDGLPTASDRAAFLARLVQTERHAFDFLAGEVLDRQPPDARAFL
ncbi:MAG: AAA family ATPase, partial [Chloroflexi bacterium]|nr:AAA family ATPase [Chloroflexota bacterium]